MAAKGVRRSREAGAEQGRGWDLLSLGPVRWATTSPLYPGALQALGVVIFGLVVYFGLFGTLRPAYNFATAVTWNLWWPLLPLSLLLLGRVWCAVCPLVPAISLVQRVFHPRRLPGRLLRSNGVWYMGLAFILVTWANRVEHITSSPRATAFLLLALLVGAVVAGVAYQRRAFCRYLCPIGALSGLYSMTASVELRSKGAGACDGCGKECFRGGDTGKGSEGCPLYQYVRTMDSNRNCNLCGQCIKVCPHGSVELRLRAPGRELWQLRAPLVGEALLVLLLVGMVFMQTIDMTTAWGSYMRWLMETTPIRDYNLGFTVTFAGALAVASGAYTAVSRVSSGSRSWLRNFAAYGYAYIPLALMVHLGHNSMHLVSEGPSALRTAVRAVTGPWLGGGVGASADGVPLLNLVWMTPLIALGGLWSLYAAWRIGRRLRAQGQGGRALPHIVFLVLLTGLFIAVFLLPMNLRHVH